MGVREFADQIGVSPDTLTSAEKDRRKVRAITINAYALATGVDRKWLETGEAPAGPRGPDGGEVTRSTRALDKLAAQKRSAGRNTSEYSLFEAAAA